MFLSKHMRVCGFVLYLVYIAVKTYELKMFLPLILQKHCNDIFMSVLQTAVNNLE
jgi:hypothetical protein